MNFLTEAANAEEFARKNQDVAFVGDAEALPGTHHHSCAGDGICRRISHRCTERISLENGYDLKEIGRKFVDNYIKQVMEDGFFHADPHPGNVRIRGGKIVWLDMGMMGRLTETGPGADRRGDPGRGLADDIRPDPGGGAGSGRIPGETGPEPALSGHQRSYVQVWKRGYGRPSISAR